MIRPLDLQTLYSQMGKVSKDQAISRDSVTQQQQTEAQKLQKIHNQQRHAVTKIRDHHETTDEEVAKTRLDEKDFSQYKNDGQENLPENDLDEQLQEESEEWQDPQKGRHIDISG